MEQILQSKSQTLHKEELLVLPIIDNIYSFRAYSVLGSVLGFFMPTT